MPNTEYEAVTLLIEKLMGCDMPEEVISLVSHIMELRKRPRTDENQAWHDLLRQMRMAKATSAPAYTITATGNTYTY